MGESKASHLASKALGRSLEDFQPLYPAEIRLIEASRVGEIAFIGEDRPEAESDTNTVRANFVRFLTLGGDEQTPIHEQGIQLYGAWIAGVLDLSNTHLPNPLQLFNCHLTEELILRHTHIPGGLNLSGSHVAKIDGDGLICDGSLFLRFGFVSRGEVRLLDAQIGGNFECTDANFDGQDGNALSAERIVVKGDIRLDKNFKASGEVRLVGALVSGNLVCSGASFTANKINAFNADLIIVKGNVFFNENLKANGEVRLLGAQIGSNLECCSASFDGKNADAITADGIVVKGDVFLIDKLEAIGEVRFLGAQIGGNLVCSNASFDSTKNNALSVDGGIIKGSVFLRESFKASGTVRLLGVKIGGNLSCNGASFDGKNGDALIAEGMTIQGAFIFRNLSKPAYGIKLSSCHVGQIADDADSWGGQLSIDGFTYDSFIGTAPTSAQARLEWLKKQGKEEYGQPANSSRFKPQPWQQLIATLRSMGHEAEAREIAIEREIHLRRIGKIGETPPEWSRARAIPYRSVSILLHWLFGILVAYGYRPLRLAAWMVAVWFVCGSFYWWAAQSGGVFAPSNPLVFHHPDYSHCRPDTKPPEKLTPENPVGNWYLCQELRGEYTGFSPYAYSLDIILPLVDLQQEHDWAPYIPSPHPNWLAEFPRFERYHWVRLAVWAEILFGWLASLLLVAVLSGLANRDNRT